MCYERFVVFFGKGFWISELQVRTQRPVVVIVIAIIIVVVAVEVKAMEKIKR